MNKNTTTDTGTQVPDLTPEMNKGPHEQILHDQQSLFRYLRDIDKVSRMTHDDTAFMLPLGYIAKAFIVAWEHPNSIATDFEQASLQLQHACEGVAIGFFKRSREKTLINRVADRLINIINGVESYSSPRNLKGVGEWKAAVALLD
jgi:hypothetical protein